MPELPEVETVRMQLAKYLIGQTIKTIDSRHKKSVLGDTTKVEGKKIVAIRRLGKMLVMDVADGYCMAVHFKMSGQLIYVSPNKKVKVAGGHPTADWIGKLPSSHTRAIIFFESGDIVYFNDQRIFGWIKILSDKELVDLPFVQRLGPEPWDITDLDLYERLHKKNKAIKIAVMDQDVLSGVGNIYASDGLWEARIAPDRQASSLTLEEVASLRTGIVTVLREGIAYGGATAADAKYVNTEGLGGTYQEHFRTYARAGQACLRKDGGVIKKNRRSGAEGPTFVPFASSSLGRNYF